MHTLLMEADAGTQIDKTPALLQRVSDAEAQLSDEQAKTMRLEVTLAELQQRLSKMEELEKELEHHRYTAIHV